MTALTRRGTSRISIARAYYCATSTSPGATQATGNKGGNNPSLASLQRAETTADEYTNTVKIISVGRKDHVLS